MKKILVMLLISIPVMAAELKFTDSTTTVELSGDVVIDLNGDVTVTPAEQILIVNSQPGYVSLYTEDDYQVLVNDQVDLYWNKTFVQNCVASVPLGSGSSASWDGPVNSDNGISTVSVTIDVLPKTFIITCESIAGVDPQPQSITFVEDSVASGNPPTLSLSANPSSLSEPGNSQLTWNVNNANSCTASGGWTGSKTASNGTHNETVSLSNTTIYTLSCTNSFGTTVRSATVSVSNTQIDPICTNFPAPAGTTDQNPGGFAFEDLTKDLGAVPPNPGLPIGSVLSQSLNFEIDRNKYFAIRTQMPSTVMNRKENFNEPFGNTNRAGYTISLSKCPGDFSGSSETTNGRCVVSGGTTSLRWTTDSTESGIFRCIVEPGETYYLNVIHSLTPPYSASDCGFGDCGVLFQEVIDP